MAKKTASKTEVALPYSFTDMAKAVNEVADLAERFAKWIGAGLDLYNVRKCRKAAQNSAI